MAALLEQLDFASGRDGLLLLGGFLLWGVDHGAEELLLLLCEVVE